MSLWEIENSLYGKGYLRVCGCDEAGAGPLAGPVYAAAVILPCGLVIEGLNDSKELSEKTRERLYGVILEKAVAYAISSVSEREIDEINILNARLKAMELAINALDPPADFALIDGNRNKGITLPNETVIKGDSRSANIAAASILAKVSRDRHMIELAERYPQYRFDKHKGYGTKLHYEKIRENGPCPAHRLTYLRKMH